MLASTKEKDIILNIKKGLSINQQDSKGHTLLHHAFIKNNNLKEFLLKNGALANIKNLNGQTPIFFAKSQEDISLLLKYGALITVSDVYLKKAYDVNPIVKQFMVNNENLFNNKKFK